MQYLESVDEDGTLLKLSKHLSGQPAISFLLPLLFPFFLQPAAVAWTAILFSCLIGPACVVVVFPSSHPNWWSAVANLECDRGTDSLLKRLRNLETPVVMSVIELNNFL